MFTKHQKCFTDVFVKCSVNKLIFYMYYRNSFDHCKKVKVTLVEFKFIKLR